MKTPRDLADRMDERNKAPNIVRQRRRSPPWEARKLAKKLFEDFPSSTYLTEIESWRLCSGGTLVEWTFKRLEYPVDDSD